jgi:hypothetical protein
LGYVVSGGQDEGEVEDDKGTRLATLLDQKNYVEELNRSLAANVVNLQVRSWRTVYIS